MPVPHARLLVVADAFVDELNILLASWGLTTPATPPKIPPDPPVPLKAVRKYSTVYASDDLIPLHIDVQAVTLDEGIVDRATVSKNYGINVVVQQQVTSSVDAVPVKIGGVLTLGETDTAAVTAKIDELVDLVIAIFEHWPLESYVGNLTTVSVVASGGLTNTAVLIYSPVLLETQGRFFGMASFVFTESTR